MKPVYIDFDNNSDAPLYVQLYSYLKSGIMSGEIRAGERLPSLRELSEQIGVSITTCSRAYDQLLVEGYAEARPQSGYYVNDIGAGESYSSLRGDAAGALPPGSGEDPVEAKEPGAEYYVDYESFDFVKWKKCAAHVMTEMKEVLFSPADPQGEYALRLEISRYLYRARGVAAPPSQIVISAGVQQLTNHLARILSYMKIDLVNVEDPGYKPVQHIFRDRGFTINKIPVGPDGIAIERLPVNLSSAVYVSPSNQFPTGSVMPAARRYSLLKWARENGSVIIEDDYDSELRYFGDPVPALKSLDEHGRAVYLGSFSSTLFPAIRISYMVLPDELAGYFNAHKNDYDQTCSKIEQLTLAEFMEEGFYQQGIRKIRKLYSKKLAAVIRSFREYGSGFAGAENTRSGISVRLSVRSGKTASELCDEAGALRLHMIPLEDGNSPGISGSTAAAGSASGAHAGEVPAEAVSGAHSETGSGEAGSAGSRQDPVKPAVRRLIFYYDQIPAEKIAPAIKELCGRWAEEKQ